MEKKPKRRFLDVAKDHMYLVGVTEEDIENKIQWKTMVHCGGARQGKDSTRH